MRGFFITFEGPEGSGKSTHIELLAQSLRKIDIPVRTTREPGGTPLGEAIRELLQYNGGGEAPVPRAEVLLFLASRAQHVARLIRPAIDSGTWVLCDRFYDSTLAYQGYGRGFELAQLMEINAFATGGLVPDLTFLLDISLEESLERLAARRNREASGVDRIEAESRDFHRRIRDGFRELADREWERFVQLSTEEPCARVAEKIADVVGKRFGVEVQP